jgi:chromate transporter
MTATLETPKTAAPVTLAALFVEFLKTWLCAFGGGLVWVRRTVVDRQRWLTDAEFADVLSLCQFMPGPNIASIAVCVGARLRGGSGAVAALAGFTAIPWIIGFSVGAWLLSNAGIPVLQNILRGVSATAAGLIIATGIRLLLPHRRRPAALVFAALGFAGLAFAKFPLLVVILCLAPLSIAAAWIEDALAR